MEIFTRQRGGIFFPQVVVKYEDETSLGLSLLFQFYAYSGNNKKQNQHYSEQFKPELPIVSDFSAKKKTSPIFFLPFYYPQKKKKQNLTDREVPLPCYNTVKAQPIIPCNSYNFCMNFKSGLILGVPRPL